MKKNMKKTVAIVPATLLLAMAMPTSASAVSGHVQDFEKDTAGWSADEGTFTRVASEGGVGASSGSHYVVMSEAGASTKFGGYAEQWDGAWSTSTDVYLDPAWYSGAGFDYSVAATGSDGKHLRDFILHAAKDGNTLLVGASNNSNNGQIRTDLADRDHVVIDKAGWYTIQHSFYEQDGHLAVDVSLIDSQEKVLFTQQLASATDTMDKVGGNRYGWFPVLEGTELAIDNVRVDRVDGEAGATYTTDFSGVGITKDKTNRWHMSGSYDAGIVTTDGDARLRISNATTSGNFDGLYSPELTVAADETAKNTVFNASFVIEPTKYQEGLRVTVNPDNGQGGRDGTIAIKHENGAMSIEAADWYYDEMGELQSEYVKVARGLDVSKSHTVNMQVVKKADTSATVANDVFRVWVDGRAKVETATYEQYYTDLGQPNPKIDTLLFRLSGDKAPAGSISQGLMIDDLKMSVTTEAPPVKPTPPTTKPPVKPTPKPVAKPKAKVKATATPKKNKMHVNVNPNQGKGYWEFKIQKLTKDGWKTLPGTYKTHGKYETRTINLPKGTYRTVVLPDHGHVAGVSNAVHLKK